MNSVDKISRNKENTCYVTLAPNGRIINIHPQYSTFTQKRSIDSDHSQSIFTLIPEEYQDYFKNHLNNRHIQTISRKNYTFESNTGNRFHLAMTFLPRSQNEPDIIECLIEDQTELFQIFDKMQHSNVQLKALFNATQNSALLIDTEGNIVLINNIAAKRLNQKPEELIGKNAYDILPPKVSKKRRIQVQKVIETQQYVTFVDRRAKYIFEHHLFPLSIENGKQLIAIYAHDITALVSIQGQLKLESKILESLNTLYHKGNVIRKILEDIQQANHFHSVGIRLQEGSDYPYVEFNGFSKEFIHSENFLFNHFSKPADQEELNPPCFCGAVLKGNTPAEYPFYSKGGSFWTNDMNILMQTKDLPDNPSGYRNRCFEEGYRSIALIPLRAEENIIGLLQINDYEPDRFDEQSIVYLESLGASIGVAVTREKDREELATSRFELQKLNEIANIFLHENSYNIDREVLDIILSITNQQCGCLFFMDQNNQLRSTAVKGSYSRRFIEDSEFEYFPKTNWPSSYKDSFESGIPAFNLKEDPSDENGEQRHYTSIVPIIYRNKLSGFFGIRHTELISKNTNKKLLIKISEQIAPVYKARYDGLLHRKEQEITKKENQRLENKLQQSQKMEAIGTLAGGIAHDFNNILFAIMGYAELALNDLPQTHSAYSNIEEVLKAGSRAQALTQQILSFSRSKVRERIALKLQPIIKETIQLLRASIPSTIDILSDINPETEMVEADTTSIHQLIMNLCTNSYHAIGNNSGTLTIRLTTETIQQKKITQFSDLKPGKYACLEVGDTGAGIDSTLIQRIFDPYFTTKEKNKGTGLGLATVHSVVKAHHGAITVESSLGEGTIFKVYLPINHITHTENATKSKTNPLKCEAVGNERIMYVDDEPDILNIADCYLSNLGYRIEVFNNAVDACHKFRMHPDRYDLIVTDYSMPGKNGLELSQCALSIRPDIPIILCTGYAEDVDEEVTQSNGISEFVLKPVSPLELGRIIRKVLDK